MASDPPPAFREAYETELLQIFEQRFGHELTDRQAALLLHASASVFDRGDLSLFRTLPADSTLVQAVVREVMNKESYFFRDPPTVESLRTDVLPRLIEAASASRVLRVWSAGCSTGEELYTLSILLHELIPDLESWSVMLVGTDIDVRALAHAKVGRYKEWSLRTTSPQQRSQYFEYKPHLERYQLRPRYARAASFALHNLMDAHAPAPAPGCFDLILCRNVSIYFSRAARDVLARKLSSALAHNGCWIAGPSDPRPEADLEMRVLPGLIEYRKPSTTLQTSRATSVRPLPDLPTPRMRAATAMQSVPRPSPAPAREPSHATAEQQLQRARALADRAEVEGALRIIDQLLREDPLLADAYLLRALLVAPDDRRAIEDLRRVIYLDPTSLEAYIHLGFGLERSGDRSGAIAAFRNAAALQAPEQSAELRRIAARRMTELLAEDDNEKS